MCSKSFKLIRKLGSTGCDIIKFIKACLQFCGTKIKKKLHKINFLFCGANLKRFFLLSEFFEERE